MTKTDLFILNQQVTIMKNDVNEVDRWNDDGGASQKPDRAAGRDHHLQKVQINLGDKPEFTLNTPGEFKSGRTRIDRSHVLNSRLDYVPNLHGKIVSAREILKSKYHRPGKTDD
jgi:hypothetical protein